MPPRAIASGVRPAIGCPAKATLPPRRRRQAHHRADGRGLAHAVAAEQRDDLALAHFEVDIEQHLAASVAGLQALNLQHHASPSPR